MITGIYSKSIVHPRKHSLAELSCKVPLHVAIVPVAVK